MAGTMFTLGLQLQKPENLKAFMKRYPESWHSSLEDMYQISKASAEDTIVDCAGSHLFGMPNSLAPNLVLTAFQPTVSSSAPSCTLRMYSHQFRTRRRAKRYLCMHIALMSLVGLALYRNEKNTDYQQLRHTKIIQLQVNLVSRTLQTFR